MRNQRETEKRQALRKIARTLHRQGKSLRHIARALGIHRNTVGKLLETPEPATAGPPRTPKTTPSKLDPYRDRIRELSQEKDMTNLMILKILRQEGYTGGRSILGSFLRKLRGDRRSRKAFARYEPPPGMEAQMDWSPYTVRIGMQKTKVHIFSMILSYSRYQYVEAFLDEKQDTLLAGHIEAFDYFEGIPATVLYDNQTPVVTGRLTTGVPILHSRFAAFAEHYGFQVKVCLPYDKERKGRVERFFGYLATSFFPHKEFSCLRSLRRQLSLWLDGEETGTGNCRVHGTTKRRPVDMWLEEKDLLIPLPERHFWPTRIEQRLVAKDCLISVLGNAYTVPPAYVGKKVTVMISPKGIRVLNGKGETIAGHPIPDGKGKMVIDQRHYDQIRRCANYRPVSSLEKDFLYLFPDRADFLDGLKKRVKNVWPIHLKDLQSLEDHFTPEQMAEALAEAVQHGVFLSTYVEELLNRRYPGQLGMRRVDDKTFKPKGLELGHLELGDVDAFEDIFGDPDDPEADNPKGAIL